MEILLVFFARTNQYFGFLREIDSGGPKRSISASNIPDDLLALLIHRVKTLAVLIVDFLVNGESRGRRLIPMRFQRCGIGLAGLSRL